MNTLESFAYMKRIADAQRRLAARKLFRPGAACNIPRQPNGAILLTASEAKEVPVVNLKKRGDGVYVTPVILPREVVLATIRAGRNIP